MSGYYDFEDDSKIYKRIDKSTNKKISKLANKKKSLQPLDVSHLGRRSICSTFWGESWCNHLESFSDFSNRLPRGRSYVRKGSIRHLSIDKGKIEAIVQGNAKYSIDINIKIIPKEKYDFIKKKCTGKINSLIELLGGKLSNDVMAIVTEKQEGLYPLPGEMTFKCSCPDWANMCKHVACVLYGVGILLDKSPELLFQLRGVNHEDLIKGEALSAVSTAISSGGRKRAFLGDLKSTFGVEVEAKNLKPLKPTTKTTPKAKVTEKPKTIKKTKVPVKPKKTTIKTPKIKKVITKTEKPKKK